MNNFVKGYADDAGLDIVLDDILVIHPGMHVIKLPCTYTPGENEVAFLVPRGSTAKKGIFPIMVAIDCGYTGEIHAFVVNVSQSTWVFDPGDRVFGIVNLLKGKDRQPFTLSKEGKRNDSWNNSSGGNK